MSLRKAGCALVLSALLFNPLGLHAQNPSGAFGEVFEVRVTNVDVVATDSKGNPISGLTQANFEIYEDGKRQEITNFSEITAAAKQATTTPAIAVAPSGEPSPSRSASTRKFIFYLDGNSLGLKNRTDIVAAIDRFLTTNLEPGDQAMIANWSGGSLSVKLPWSSDHAAIASTLRATASEVGAGEAMQSQKREVLRLLRQLEKQAQDREDNKACDPTNMVTYEVVESQVRSFAESVRHDVGMSVTAMTRLLASLSGVEGKKVLVLATESLPTQAAGEVIQQLESIRQRWMAVPTPVVAASTESGSAPMSGGVGLTSLATGSRTATAMADLSRYNVSPLVDGLGRAANATGVTVYSINPKGTQGPEGTADRQDSAELSVDFAQSSQALDGVNMIARQTGGVAMIGASADDALARLSRDLSSYYSIGYRSKPGKSAERKVEVKIKQPGVTARYRKTIYYRSLDAEMSDHVIANHLQTDYPNELGIALQADPVTTEGGHRLVPMRVIIPADSLTLLPDEEGNVTGGFSVFTSTGSADTGGNGVNVQSQQIKWPAQQAAQMKGRRIGFAVQVPVDKNPKQISVGVVDHVSQEEGFAMIKIATN